MSWRVRCGPTTIWSWCCGLDSEAVNRGKNRVRVELAHVKGLVAALAEAAADPVALPTTGGEYHG